MTYTLRILVASVILFLPLSLYAAEFRSGDQPSVSRSAQIAGDLYMAGGTVTSGGTVTGDLVIAGGTLLVEGTVTQDVLAAGGTITILGPVGDDVRAVGGALLVRGTVGSDAILAGGQITLSGEVGGDAVVTGGTVIIDAPVRGNLKIAGGDVRINAPIDGNVEMQAGNATLGSGAVIQGSLTYSAPQEIRMDDGARVVGETTYTPRADERENVRKGLAALAFGWLFVKFLMLLVAALVFGLVFRTYAGDIAAGIMEEPLKNFGIGFIALVVIPVVAVLLLVTVIGLPIGILAFLGYVALLIFANIFSPVILGTLLMRWWRTTGYEVTWLTILVGVVVWSLVGIVPILGGLAQFVLMLSVFGMIVRMKWRIARRFR